MSKEKFRVVLSVLGIVYTTCIVGSLFYYKKLINKYSEWWEES